MPTTIASLDTARGSPARTTRAPAALTSSAGPSRSPIGRSTSRRAISSTAISRNGSRLIPSTSPKWTDWPFMKPVNANVADPMKAPVGPIGWRRRKT